MTTDIDPDPAPDRQIVERRRKAEFVTPIPQPRKRKGGSQQAHLVSGEGKDISTTAPRSRRASASSNT